MASIRSLHQPTRRSRRHPTTETPDHARPTPQAHPPQGTGDPGKRPLSVDEPQPEPAIPDCPPELGDAAKREWDRLVDELATLRILTNLDHAALAAYCNAYPLWADSIGAIQKYGTMVKSPNGYPVQSPYIAIANRQAEIMLRIASEFGFTPASRSHIAAPSPAEPSLFDMLADEPPMKNRRLEYLAGPRMGVWEPPFDFGSACDWDECVHHSLLAWPAARQQFLTIATSAVWFRRGVRGHVQCDGSVLPYLPANLPSWHILRMHVDVCISGGHRSNEIREHLSGQWSDQVGLGNHAGRKDALKSAGDQDGWGRRRK
jgi:P27 family predicted phage terminase small subunit